MGWESERWTAAQKILAKFAATRGWCNSFRHGVSSRTFNYVDSFAFWRIVGWLRKRHVGLNMHTLVRRYLPGWKISDGGIEMFRPYKVNIERYRYRGARIPAPCMVERNDNRITCTSGMNTWRAGCGESRRSGSEGGPEKPTSRKADRALRSDPYTEHWTGEGKLYLCAVKDVYSNRIVGYSINSRMKARLAVAALDNAVARRGDVAGCILHCDRGSPFRSRKQQRAFTRHEMVGSMGQVGSAGDKRGDGIVLRAPPEERP